MSLTVKVHLCWSPTITNKLQLIINLFYTVSINHGLRGMIASFRCLSVKHVYANIPTKDRYNQEVRSRSRQARVFIYVCRQPPHNYLKIYMYRSTISGRVRNCTPRSCMHQAYDCNFFTKKYSVLELPMGKWALTTSDS